MARRSANWAQGVLHLRRALRNIIPQLYAFKFKLYATLLQQLWEVIQRVPGGRNILITLENADLFQPRIG